MWNHFLFPTIHDVKMSTSKIFVICAIYLPLLLIGISYHQISDFYAYSVPLNHAKIIPNFPQTNQNQFQQVYQEKDSTCITTPSQNQYCYKKPKLLEGQDRDHLSSIIVGDNGINGEIHFDKVGLDGGIFTIKNMSRINDNSALFTFADKDYRIGNKDRTTYEITEKFEFDTVVKKFDSFITHCGNFDGSAATIVQYLGVTNIDGVDYFVTWHTVITSQDNFQCKYPELIQQSLKHEFKEL